MRLDTLRARFAEEQLAIERVELAYEEGSYSQERMEEKVAMRSKVIAEVEEEIAQAEAELRLLGAAGMEVQKLRTAAEQVDFNLDNLDKRGRKILCDLFIDRIEMRHVEEDGERKIRANIVFQFNPAKLQDAPIEGRKNSSQHKAKRGQLKNNNVVDGGRPQT